MGNICGGDKKNVLGDETTRNKNLTVSTVLKQIESTTEANENMPPGLESATQLIAVNENPQTHENKPAPSAPAPAPPAPIEQKPAKIVEGIPLLEINVS